MKKQIIILSGEIMERTEMGAFVIDPASVQLHKPRLIVDYNHNEEEVIGFVENIHPTDDGKLMGDLTLESTSPNDRAAEVIARIEGGTPYEISPTVMLYEAGVETETVTADNETEYTIFKNVPMRGVSICPYGTDRLTTILSLNGGKKTMKKRTKKNLTKLAADEILDEAMVETTVAEETAGESGAPEYTAHPDLEEFIAAFGFDLGVEYYRRGLTFEEAEKEDYAALKAARLAAENEELSDAGAIETVDQVDNAVAEANTEAAIVAEAQAAVDEAVEETQEKTGLKANIVLAKTVRALAQEVTKLKALSVRGTDALASSQRKAVPMTAVQKMANKIHNRK